MTRDPKNGHLPRTMLRVGQAVWGSPDGLLHWAIGDRLVSPDAGTFVVWTACRKYDVPANAAWYHRQGIDQITCLECEEAKAALVEVCVTVESDSRP